LPTDTPTPPPTATPVRLPPSSTPAPQAPAARAYPPIPPGKGLLYVINFHGDEAQFYFIGQQGEYPIPGKAAAPEGGVLELFLDPGAYRWASRIPTAGLSGEGELQIATGQIHGLGLIQGLVGDRSVVEGFWIGADPFAPAQTPTPTPSPGKAVLVLDSGSYSGDVQFPGATYQILGGKSLFLEVEPGFQDINVTYYVPGEGETVCGFYGCGLTGNISFKFQLTLPADSICDLFIGAQQSESSLNCKR
jgi:hypothetical protein